MPELHDASQQEISDDATIGFDADGRVLSVSESAAVALGYSDPSELRGALLSSLVGEEAAIRLLDRLLAHGDLDMTGDEAAVDLPADAYDEAVTFARQDGARVSLNTMLTPEPSGGWITLLDSAGGASNVPGESAEIDVATVLRRLATGSLYVDGVAELSALYVREIAPVFGSGVETVAVVRSSSVSGVYDALATGGASAEAGSGETVELPVSLVPRHGHGPVAVESLESLALFEPVMLRGVEISGAYLAARAEIPGGGHVLVLVNAAGGRAWTESEFLLLEAGTLTFARALHAAELASRVATHSRISETVRQVGMLASRDHDGGFLDAARSVLARRLPVAAISIHVADPVTARCYVAATSDSEHSEFGSLAPAFEWQLAGSLEQRVIKAAAPVMISSASAEPVNVPAATVAQWRSAGLQAVAAIPLREAGEVVAVMLAGFNSPISRAGEVIRLLESVTPAVHLGVGLSSGRPGALPGPEDSTADPGFISPKTLLALTRAAAESPDRATLFASVTEWLLEVIPSARVAWGTIDKARRTYDRVYNYNSTSAARAGEESLPVDADSISSLDMSGLGLSEPGQPAGERGPMRAAVKVEQRLLAVVTAWPRDGEQYSTGDLARLERICEFISGPLDRILETEAARESQRLRDLAAQIGAQASEFHEASQAFRSLHSQVKQLIPHDRAIFLEIDQFDAMAVARYDSAVLPGQQETAEIPLAALPSAELVGSTAPISISLANLPSAATASLHTVFQEQGSLISVPVQSGEGPQGLLLLMSEAEGADQAEQIELATVLAGQLKGAWAGWQAHRSTRESARDMREVRKQLNLILESAPVALISTDPSGVCTRLEGHGLETLGIKREDMQGRSIFELTGKLPELEDAIRQALRGAPASALTTLGSRSAQVWAQPVTEIDGSVKGVTLVGYDVSDRVRRLRAQTDRRELKEILQERSRIVGTVSHEMRNQLQSIIAYADILSVGTEGQLSSSTAQALSVIQSTASRLDRMISDLPGLNYELDISEVNVNNLMQEIFEAQEPIFTSAGQTFALSLPDLPYTVPADHLRLTQVVTNLLSNASKYSPREASISVEVSVSGDDLDICVVDTGPGIPADQLERVWDSGIRLDSSKTSSVKGSGLGLSIARTIVDMHGGEATIESEVGRGTSVRVTLPGAKVIEEPDTGDEAVEQETDESTVKAPAANAKRSKKPAAKAKPAADRPTRRRRRSGT